MIGPRASRHGRLAGALIAVAAGIGAFGAATAGAETYVVKGGENAITGTAELVSAVAKANAHAGANTIVLGSGSYLPAKPLKLTNTSGPQTIEGPAGTPTTKTPQADLNGSSEEPIAELILVEPGVTVTFKDVEISGQGGEGLSAIEILGENQVTSTPGGDVTLEDVTLANTGVSVSVGGHATLTARNTTISDGRVEGVVVNEGKAHLLNSTVYGNKGTGVDNNGGEVTLTNTIVAENQGGDCIGPIVSDHSLDSDGSCEVGALSSKNPDLGSSLVIIGGSTPLHAVKAGSPAIDAGDPSTCLATDQRGAPRPGIKGDACTLGADEYGSTPPVVKVPATLTVPAEGAAGAIVDYEASAEGVDDGITSFSCNDPTASTFPVGETTVTCTAVDGHENKTTVQFTVIVTSGTTTSSTTSTTTSTTSESTTTSTSTSTTTEAPSTTTTTSTTSESPSTTSTTSSSSTTTSTTSTTESPSTTSSTSTTESPSTTSTTSTTEAPPSTTESPSTSTSSTTTTTTTSAAPVAPTVLTLPALAVTAGGATLTAQVNPNGSEVTTCLIEYGTTTAYGQSAPCAPAPGAGTSVVSVEAVITGLAADTPYDYRVTATNAAATVEGENLTFTTLEEVTTTTTSTTSTTTSEPSSTSTSTTTSEAPPTTTETTSTTSTTSTTTSEPPTTTTTSTSTTTSEPPTTTTSETSSTETSSTETSSTSTTTSAPTTSTTSSSPTTTTTSTTITPTTSTTTTTTTTTTSEEVPPGPSAIALLEQLQRGVEGAPIPRHLRRELAGLLYDARVTLETPRPWFFPFPHLWQSLVQWQADGDLHVFVAVIEQDQLSHRDQIPPQLAEIGIQLAQNIEALLHTDPGHIDLF